MVNINDITSFVIPILLSVIAFWLVRFVKIVDELKKTISLIQIENSGKNASCTEKHITINDRFTTINQDLKDVRDDIDDHESRIKYVETKLEKK